MKRLSENLASHPGDRQLLLHGDLVLSAKEILTRVAAARASDALPAAGQCYVDGKDDLDSILTMIAADGWSAEIVLGKKKLESDANLCHHPTVAACAVPCADTNGAGAQASDTRWLLATSGTTGQPKWVAHTLACLTRTIKTDPAKGATIRWGLLYDPLRFAGLQVVLQAMLGGSSLVVPTDRTDLPGTVAEFRGHGVNALSTTPSYWRKLLMAGIADGLDLRFVSLGGEIADAAILAALRRAFPNARITHIYASTEAGVSFAVSDGLAGIPARYLQQPPQGVELRVDAEGQLLVRSDLSPRGYEDGTPITGDEGWVGTEDLVQERGNRYYYLGRAGGIINVGGDKVHPKEIEDVALAVPGVALAHVRAKLNPIVGQVPELFVEPTCDAEVTTLRESVLQRCRAELPRAKWPAAVHVVDELKLSAAGKMV